MLLLVGTNTGPAARGKMRISNSLACRCHACPTAAPSRPHLSLLAAIVLLHCYSAVPMGSIPQQPAPATPLPLRPHPTSTCRSQRMYSSTQVQNSHKITIRTVKPRDWAHQPSACSHQDRRHLSALPPQCTTGATPRSKPAAPAAPFTPAAPQHCRMPAHKAATHTMPAV